MFHDQCTALLGQNGAGKSTTFSMLTGEVRPSAGQLYLNNKLVNSTQLCRGLISKLSSYQTVNVTRLAQCLGDRLLHYGPRDRSPHGARGLIKTEIYLSKILISQKLQY